MDDFSTCTVGIDLGDRKSVACIYDQGVVQMFEFAMTKEGIAAAFPAGKFRRLALEAGAQSGWVTRQLRTQGYEPIVANPRKVKAISANERKSDYKVSILLAKLAAADASLLYPIQHRSEVHELALTVLRARDAAVKGRAALVNTVRSLGKSVGFRFRAATPEGFPRLEALAPEKVVAATTGLFSMIRAFNDEIKGYDAQLEQLCDTFPAVQRVRQVNGVGPVTGLAFVLTLDSVGRFADGRSAAAYLGLVPRRDQSGNSDKQLRISKTGNDFVGRNLEQCAQYITGAPSASIATCVAGVAPRWNVAGRMGRSASWWRRRASWPSCSSSCGRRVRSGTHSSIPRSPPLSGWFPARNVLIPPTRVTPPAPRTPWISTNVAR